MEKLVTLYKIGKSEHKRTDLINSYFSFIYAITNNDKLKNKSWKNDKNIICEVLTNYRVLYNKKCDSPNLNREKSLFESLNLIKKNQNIIPTEFTKHILSNENINTSKLGMNSSEYHYLLMILFNYSENNDMQTFEIIDNILNNKEYFFKKNDLLINELMKMDEDDFRNELFNQIKFKSGSSKSIEKDGKKIKLKMAKDEILKLWIDWMIKQDDITERNLLNLIIEYKNLFKMKSKDFLKDAMAILICDSKHFKKLYKNLDNDEVFSLKSFNDEFDNTREEIINRAIRKIIKGSEKDYLYLIKNHLLVLQQFFYFDSIDNKIKIFNEHKDFIFKIISKKKELIQEFRKNNYIAIDKFIDILDMKEVVNIDNSEVMKIYKTHYGTSEQIIEILKKFIIVDNENDMRKKVDSYIKNSQHLNGLCDAPTFFEFLSSYSILFKNHNDIFEKTSTEFIDLIKKSLNLKFSQKNLVPIRFAAGNRPDAIIKTIDGDIIVEPTLQLKRQVKMELDSVTDHINKHKYKINSAYIIAPIIEERLNTALKSFVENNLIKVRSVFAINVKELIEYIKK